MSNTLCSSHQARRAPTGQTTVFAAGTVAVLQGGHATLAGIVQDLRVTDVHPPMYFWAYRILAPILGPRCSPPA